MLKLRKTNKATLAFISLLAAACAVAPLKAGTVVVPNANSATDGSRANRFPLLVDGGIRYQQVHAADQFGSLAAGGELITGLAFRMDSGNFGGSFGPLTINNLSISLSTTSAAPGGLSTVFANNVGVDNTVVLSGSATIGSSNLPGLGDTRDFDVAINFTTPFLYNPSNGNLLLDILNADPADNEIGLFFDAIPPSGSVSRLYSSEGVPGAASGTLGNITEGLVVQFSTQLVPEPTSLVLALLGLILSQATSNRIRKRDAAAL